MAKPPIPEHFSREHIRSLQMALNEKVKCKIVVNGKFEKDSISALKIFQINNRLFGTGIYDAATQEVLEPFIDFKYLQERDYVEAAGVLQIQVAALKSLVEVVARSDGFIPNGRCVLSLNCGRFYQVLSQRRPALDMDFMMKKYPTVVRPTVDAFIGDDEYLHFATAIAIDSDAAMKSTSWGMFHIYGSEYFRCGYQSVMAMVSDMQHSERRQLHAYTAYLKTMPSIVAALREGNWREVSKTMWKHYNEDIIRALTEKYERHHRLSKKEEAIAA